MKHHCHLLVVRFNCDIPYNTVLLWFLFFSVNVIEIVCAFAEEILAVRNWDTSVPICFPVTMCNGIAVATLNYESWKNKLSIYYRRPYWQFPCVWFFLALDGQNLCTIKKAIPSNLDDPSASNEATKRTILFYSVPNLELDASFSSLWCTEVREVWDQGETETQCVLMGAWGEFEL